MHAWDQPAEVLLQSAPKSGARLVMPRLGEPVEPIDDKSLVPWWREVESAIERTARSSTPPMTLSKHVNWPID